MTDTIRKTAEAILELPDGLIGITTEVSGLERFTERVCSSNDLKALARAYLAATSPEDLIKRGKTLLTLAGKEAYTETLLHEWQKGYDAALSSEPPDELLEAAKGVTKFEDLKGIPCIDRLRSAVDAIETPDIVPPAPDPTT